MSGRAKRNLYYAADWLLFFGAIALAVVTAIFTFPAYELGLWEYVAVVSAAVLLFLRFPALVHELGHLLFGTLAGMKAVRFRFSVFGGETAGATEMFPRSGEHVKRSAVCFALGGAALNFLCGALFLLPYFLLPYHAVWLLFFVLAPFLFYEGVRALLPAELPAGKTDGAVLWGLLSGKSEEEVLLRVLTAQGILYRGEFSGLPEELFRAPVVREDLPAYRALRFLEMQYALSAGEEERALGLLSRLRESCEEGSPEENAECERYAGCFEGGFVAKPSPLAGVNALETRLSENEKKL